MKKGFTVIELLVAIVVLGVAGWLFFQEKAANDATERDSMRKTSINAMYYNLEEVYYSKFGYYPISIDSKTLRAMDPELFTDPYGYKLGEDNQYSDFSYDATECDLDNHCKSYTLRSSMEREGDYVKKSRQHS